MPLKLLFFIFLGFLTSGKGKQLGINHTAFEDVHKWKYIEYEFDSVAEKEKIVNSSDYDKSNIIILDFDLAKDGRTFVAFNKRKGVPATLGTVSKRKSKGGPLVKPYPTWKWHTRKDCIGIFKAVKIAVDDCNRLWVLDNGVTDSSERKCPAQLLMFDLSSNKLKSRINIPKEFFKDRDGQGDLNNIIVQAEGWWCQSTKVYMTYDKGTGIVVWNGKDLWRLNGPDLSNLKGSFKSGNKKFRSSGIFGFAMSPNLGKNPQVLAMRSAANRNMITVKIDDIIATTPGMTKSSLNLKWFDFSRIFNAIKSEPPKVYDNSTVKYKLYKDVLPSPSAAQIFNPRGILFLGLTEVNAIACWNMNQNLTEANIDIIDKDKDKLQFVHRARIFQSSRTGRSQEELWIHSSRFADYVYNNLDFKKFNYIIMKQSTKRILTNSKCMT